MTIRRSITAIAVALALTGAACGQKPGVNELTAGALEGGLAGAPPGAQLDAEGNLVDPETGAIVATAEQLESGALTFDAGGAVDVGIGAAGGDEGSAPGTAPGTDAGAAAGGDATGVSDDAIRIGIHAPVTGAAPIPSASFQKGTTLYWEYLRAKGKSILGRDVEVFFRNDNYNPSQAVSVCRELVEKEKVFLLVGIAGTDQIQACARYAASVGVPYISTGVTEIELETLPNYFAVSMSYKQQGPLLADMLIDKLDAKDEANGMVRFATPLFEDAHDSFIDAMDERDAAVEYDRAISKTAGQSEAAGVATELAQRGIENVYVLTSPTFFLQLANAAANQGYRPQWVGVGLTMTLDTVADVGCRNSRSLDDARFLNFFPAFADADTYDPQFLEAGGDDDIQFGLWGISRVVAEMLAAPGRDLTREAFVAAGEKLAAKTPVLPRVDFSESRFGGTAMHLSRAECDQNRWVTEKAFASDF